MQLIVRHNEPLKCAQCAHRLVEAADEVVTREVDCRDDAARDIGARAGHAAAVAAGRKDFFWLAEDETISAGKASAAL